MPTVMLLVASACVSTSSPDNRETSPSPSAVVSEGRIGSVSVEVAVVKRIVDGDTARMDFRGIVNEKVRFIGMDTPERGRPYFSEATRYAASHLQGKEVYLELDIDERDRFGRLLAYVWLAPPTSRSEHEIRTKMFNAKALLDGYAALLTVPPNVRYVDHFRAIQRVARDGNRGLWGLG